jgi:hypothetical protein
MSIAALALTALVASAPSANATAKAPTTVLVLDIAGDAVTRGEAGALRDTLASELAKRRKYSVLTSEDVRRVLDVEAQRQAAGCEGESSCLAEIGAALGADRVLYGNVARLGGALVVSLSVVDPEDARAFGRDTFQAGDVEEVGRMLPDAATRLFGPPRGAASGGAPVTITGGVITALGAAGVAGLGGTTLYLLGAVQDPGSSPETKQLALEQGPNFLIATIVSGGVLVIGGAIALAGVIVE